MDIPRPPYDCVETEEGWVRFEAGPGLPPTPADQRPCVRLYDPSLGDGWLSRFTHYVFPPEKGVYTWLLYTKEDSSELHFVCKKTQSLYEIGTRHKAIARDPELGVHTVYGAGELERPESGPIQFNLASGAYMLNFLKGTARNKSSQEKRRKIVEMVQTFLPGASDTEDDKTSLLSGTEHRFRVYAFDPIPKVILNLYRMRLNVVPCDPPNASSSSSASSSAAAASSTPVGGGGYQGVNGFSAASPVGGSSAAAVPSTPVGGGGGLFYGFIDSSAASSAGGGLGLFGRPVGSSVGGGGGLFGSPVGSSAASPVGGGGGLFGSPVGSSAASPVGGGGGLFGSPVGSSAGGGGGLFGSPVGSSAGGGLFGSPGGSSRTRRNIRRRKRRQTRRRRNQA